MPHFLIKKEEISDNIISLKDNENFFHIVKVLRKKQGEKIKFIDENRIIYNCIIKEITKNTLTAEISNKKQSDRMLKFDLRLAQSILAQDAQNLAIANATQTGVREFYPVISDNVSNQKTADSKKLEKWKKIAQENFKQCERADLMTIHQIKHIKDILSEKYENITLNECINDIDKAEPILIIIGPEGGFSEEEFQYFIKEQYKLITLGKMIYKAPNAIIAGISNIASRIEC